MGRWSSYIYERFPPLIYGSLSFGLALSGASINKANVSTYHTILAFIGLWVFLFTLRLANDINDVQKDKIAFPDRPLPKGTIKVSEAKQLLFVVQLFLFAYSQLLWILLQETAAMLFLILACWSWLASREYYAKDLLQRLPFVASLWNQMYTIPMALFAVGVSQPARVFGVKSWALAVAVYGAMLTFQLCRTFNPHLHPIVAAYIHFYGFRSTFYFACLGIVISAVAAKFLGVMGLLWPVQGVLLGAMILQFFQPEQYRISTMAATVSLIVHAWAGIF